jgi:hypothetical protein
LSVFVSHLSRQKIGCKSVCIPLVNDKQSRREDSLLSKCRQQRALTSFRYSMLSILPHFINGTKSQGDRGKWVTATAIALISTGFIAVTSRLICADFSGN